MINDLSSDKKYDIINIQANKGTTSIHYAAYAEH